MTLPSGIPVPLASLPRPPQPSNLPVVEVCSAKVGIKAVRQGADAWFIMVRPEGKNNPSSLENLQLGNMATS